MKSTASGTHPFWIVLLSSVWMATLSNLALWQELAKISELFNTRGLLLGLGLAIGVAAVIGAVLSALAWRWTLKPVVFLFLVTAAASTYFMQTYRIVIDTSMLVNVLQTDPRETRDLLSWQLLTTVVLLALLPAWWLLRRPVQKLSFVQQAGVNALTIVLSGLLAVGALWAIFQDFSSLMRNRTELRFMINPLNTVYAIGDLLLRPSERDHALVQPIGQDAARGASYHDQAKPPLLLLVVGETARAANFSLNGYHRPTNPRLAREDVVSFRQVRSCGTSTASSLPCMFSHLGREAYLERKVNYQNLLDVLQNSGLAVLWIDNQSGCKGLCERVHHVDTSKLTIDGLCANGECFDEVMLTGLDKRIQELPVEQRRNGVVVIFHPMGSHGPAYFKRAPKSFKAFLPECSNNLLQECSQSQIVNAYDNSILYADHVLAQSLQWLKGQSGQYAASMIYMSDHGESLGENNLYLHGLPYAVAPDVQKHVPLITWLSAAQQQRSRINNACLQSRVQEPLSHDNLFHSVLGLMDIQSSTYRRELDWFAPCVR